ncbi:MAG: hypothetical protein LBS20_21635 [Prevotella sp.]|jgi:hypothetical protein|nr:hypothetical protein [Prevotella sp.]
MSDISFEDFENLSNQDFIVDAREGGLIIGRSHDEGNIYVIIPVKDGYNYVHPVEGGEYIVNHISSMKHWDRIRFINSHKASDCTIHIDILRKTPLLVTQGRIADKLLLIHQEGQYVVNKRAACLFLEELNAINSDKDI